MMKREGRFASEALEYAYETFIGDDAEQAAAFEEELANAEIGRQVHDPRTAAGLTRGQLAKLVGTTAAVVGRLEDADHQGCSLAMLRRVARALNRQVEIRFPSRSDASRPA